MTERRRCSVDVWVTQWRENVIDSVCERLAERTPKALRSRSVSLLTGALAAALFCPGGTETLIAHHEDGKPYLPDAPELTLSISHSDSIAAVSCSCIVHGIDLERERPINERLFRRVFSPEEQAVYNERIGMSGELYFLREWTRKEALIKTGALTLGRMNTVNANDSTLTHEGFVYFFETGTFFRRSFMADGINDICTLSLCSREIPCDMEILFVGERHRRMAFELLERLYFNKQ